MAHLVQHQYSRLNSILLGTHFKYYSFRNLRYIENHSSVLKTLHNQFRACIFNQFRACVLKLLFKQHAIFILTFLGNVIIDVNGKVAFSIFHKTSNFCL